MKRRRLVAPARFAAALAGIVWAATCGAVDVNGYVRPAYVGLTAGERGPLADANRIAPGTVPTTRSGPEIDSELRASGHGISAVAFVQAQRQEGDRWRAHGHFDELYVSGSLADWQMSAGKKIVSWDVGYAFRPNDFVEQEPRRLLLETTPEGRTLVSAEHFDASTAWSFVLVNPTRDRSERGAREPALAARVYRRDGAFDWHGFARLGERTGASVGAASAWVASDSIELHASVRYLQRADTLALDTNAVAGAPLGLVRADPWTAATARRVAQALVGGTWTNAEQLSLLAEAWWDDTALDGAAWDRWNARSRALGRLAGSPAPASAVAGNLAWQGSALEASTSLRRTNLFARLSWQHDKWQPAIDILYTPADSGHVITASLGWQGDRVRVDGGVRTYGGPGGAVLAQLPTKRIVYFAGTWSF
ncbi:MAG: hypothetical protein ABIZ18_14405 [Caldimonas sp.]